MEMEAPCGGHLWRELWNESAVLVEDQGEATTVEDEE